MSLFLATSVCVLADNVKISGKVIDNEDKPVEFATVKIAGTAIGTNTDLKGVYSLSVAATDTLKVVFSCIGFKTVTHQLIKPQGDLTLNVRLYPDDVTLQDVEVVGFRKNINGMQSLDTESFKLSPDVSGGSVEAMITTMAGVNSSNEMSSQYSVRGGSFDENSVYINGTEIYRPQLVRSGQQEGLSIINPDMVGNLSFPPEVPGTVCRQDVVRPRHNIPRARSPRSGGFSFAYGRLTHFRTELEKIHTAPRSASEEEQFASLLVGDTRRIRPSVFRLSDQYDVQGERPFPGQSPWQHIAEPLQLQAGRPHNEFRHVADVKQFKVYFDGEEKDKFETYLGALTASYRLNRATSFDLSLSAFLTNELVSYDISGEYWLNQAGTGGEDAVGGELGVGKYMEHSRNRLKASVIQMALKGRTVIRNNHLSYGFIFQHENFRDRTREWEWRDSAGYSLPTAPPGVHLIYNLASKQDISNSRIAFFAEDALYLTTKAAYLTLNGGLRFSYWSMNKEFLVSPRVNLSISPLNFNRWNYRVAVGLYYQSPFYKEYRQALIDDYGNSVVQLNRNIKSPRSLQFIVGADYEFRMFNRPFKLTGEAYYKALSNLISYEYDNLKVSYSGINDSKGHIMGLDFKLFGQFVPGSDSWLTFSLMNTSQKLNGKSVPLPSDQRYSVALYFTDYFPKFPKLKFSLRGVISDGLTMTAPRVSRDQSWFRAPSYKRVDIGLSYQFVGAPSDGVRPYNFWRHFKSIVLGVDCFNLFDISNVSSYYWVTDVNDIQYAVPNYLTRRQFNVRLALEF